MKVWRDKNGDWYIQPENSIDVLFTIDFKKELQLEEVKDE